jgi:hypothetical protein
MYKKSVLFFTENGWAFGQIHNALIKRLWEHGIYAHILDWRINYSPTEVEYLKKKFDLFYTNPPQVPHLLFTFGVPAERVVTVAHAEVDIFKLVQSHSPQMFNGLKSYGVINSDMVETSKKFGVERVPSVALNGIDFDHFYCEISPKLKTVGYAGALHHITSAGTDCKRRNLVELTLNGLPFGLHGHSFMHHLCMAGWYADIDALLIPSSYEACGLPMMEAAAAGRMVLCSNGVGYFDGNFGVACRLPENEWIQDAKAALLAHQDPAIYLETCERSQQYARDNFDWSNRIENWVKLFE